MLRRGDVKNPGPEVGPGALDLIPGLPGAFDLPAGHAEGDRRAALAAWLTDPRNPLTWRSIVNRVWQYHFGRAIAATPNDFGRMGQPPTHPELLDWLATDFRDGGQSLKSLHRLIVTSAAYRQSSAGDPRAESIDAGNAYLWRMSRRKLEAEAVRDAALAVAGKLDRTLYGPPFRDFVVEHPEHSPHYEYHLHDPADPKAFRRSVYRFLARSKPSPFMTVLDCADPSMQVDKRNRDALPAASPGPVQQRVHADDGEGTWPTGWRRSRTRRRPRSDWPSAATRRRPSGASWPGTPGSTGWRTPAG